MIERRYRPGVAVLGGKIYVLGGEEGWDHYHDTIECYDPIQDKWELVGEMGSSRSWLSCVGLTVKLGVGSATGEEKSWRWGISVSNPVQLAATRRQPRGSGGNGPGTSQASGRGPDSGQETPLVIHHPYMAQETEDWNNKHVKIHFWW